MDLVGQQANVTPVCELQFIPSNEQASNNAENGESAKDSDGGGSVWALNCSACYTQAAHLWTVRLKYSFIDGSVFHFQLTFGTLSIRNLSLISVCRETLAHKKKELNVPVRGAVSSDHRCVHTVRRLFLC